MRSLSTAITGYSKNKNDVIHLHIEHGIVKGVTPEMLEWWFKNIGGEMEYQGKRYQRYHVWHPLDHIHWGLENQLPCGQVGVGSKFHIVEALGRNMDMLVNVVDTVKKLDKQGILLEGRLAGIRISSLSHQFIAAGGGAKYISDLRIGVDNLFGKYILNPIIRKKIFTKSMGRAWLRHNIEEVGNFEFFLPVLYWTEKNKAIGRGILNNHGDEIRNLSYLPLTKHDLIL
jgi:DAPG hydrolase PhiG domain